MSTLHTDIQKEREKLAVSIEEQGASMQDGPQYGVWMSKKECELAAAALRTPVPVASQSERGLVTVPQFLDGERVNVACSQYTGIGVVERCDRLGNEVIGWRHGTFIVNVRTWIGSWEDGYAHSNAWYYPATAVCRIPQQVGTAFGIPIIADERVPMGEVQLRTPGTAAAKAAEVSNG